MDTATILRIVFTALLCLPLLVLSFFFVGKLLDTLMDKPGKRS